MSLNKGRRTFLIAGKRTPFGSFGGPLKDISPVDLATYAGKGLIEKLNISPEQIDQVILGNVITSSTDTMYGGRHLALKLGCKESTPGVNVNRLCGSGIQSILDAVRLIKLGEANLVLAGGTENMSMTPHLMYGGRFGTKYGNLGSVDMLLDALMDKYAGVPMGVTAENLSEKFEISRKECDQFSMDSHKKANAAYSAGLFDDELCPVEVKKGIVTKDGHLREDISLDQMEKLRPSFVKDGVVTPATASGIVDGAAVVLIGSEDFCKDQNLIPLAEIIDGYVVGVDPKIMGIGPSPAISSLLQRNNLSIEDVDLVEINEAFAGQTLSCIKDLKLDSDKVNKWGGAIALGHPLAASGTRISLTLARQLQHFNKKYGIASACIGGGQGIALLLKSC